MAVIWIGTGRFGQLWTPANITTALWLDAADASTVTTVSGAVSQWNDKSGNGRNASQSTTTARPAYTSGGLNSLNVLTFDGDDTLVGNAQIANPGFGMFIVCSFNNNTTRMAALDIGSAGGAFRFCSIEQNTFQSLQQRYGFYVTNSSQQSSVATSSGYKIMLATSAAIAGSNVATTTTYRINGSGATLTPTAPGVNYETIAAGYTVGGITGITSSRLVGSVAEVIAFSALVDTLTIQRIEGYLAHKWGLTASLPADHPFKTAAPTI